MIAQHQDDLLRENKFNESHHHKMLVGSERNPFYLIKKTKKLPSAVYSKLPSNIALCFVLCTLSRSNQSMLLRPQHRRVINYFLIYYFLAFPPQQSDSARSHIVSNRKLASIMHEHQLQMTSQRIQFTPRHQSHCIN